MNQASSETPQPRTPPPRRPETPWPDGVHVVVVIPAYQAASSIAAVIGGIPDGVQVIAVVDDASTDGTAEAARAAGDPRVEVLSHESNQGVGGAMRTGYRFALEQGADIAVKVDADGQMDTTQLVRLLEPIVSGRADYVKGNRLWSGGYFRSMPGIRLFGNAALSFLTKLSSGAWHVFDPCNGYTAIGRDALHAIDWDRIHPRYFFESSMLALLTVARAVIADVPMPARYGDEVSHLSVRRVLLEFPLLHLRYAAWRFRRLYLIQDFNACSLLFLLGVPVFLFGVIDGIWVWIESARTGQPALTGTVILPALATILGFQMLLHALMLDVTNAPRRPLLGTIGEPPVP